MKSELTDRSRNDGAWLYRSLGRTINDNPLKNEKSFHHHGRRTEAQTPKILRQTQRRGMLAVTREGQITAFLVSRAVSWP